MYRRILLKLYIVNKNFQKKNKTTCATKLDKQNFNGSIEKKRKSNEINWVKTSFNELRAQKFF